MNTFENKQIPIVWRFKKITVWNYYSKIWKMKFLVNCCEPLCSSIDWDLRIAGTAWNLYRESSYRHMLHLSLYSTAHHWFFEAYVSCVRRLRFLAASQKCGECLNDDVWTVDVITQDPTVALYTQAHPTDKGLTSSGSVPNTTLCGWHHKHKLGIQMLSKAGKWAYSWALLF